MIKSYFRTFALLLAVLCASLALGRDFTQADLEKVVKELEVYTVKNPQYVYPIQCEVIDKEDVNAYATVAKTSDGKFQTRMVVFTGLVKFMKGDVRVIRAVVAHEISHLSKGHCTAPGMVPGDLDNLWTRQQEFEADITGAALLQKAGYSKQDMVDMLLALDAASAGMGWLDRQVADHASCKARAAQVADNPTVLRSLVDFEAGLAYMECRQYEDAIKAFDRAIKKEPKLKEAYINSAQSALMFYYDNLPVAIRETWYLPDFGPMLAPPIVSNREVSIRDSDRERYREALKRVAAAVDANKSDSKAAELAMLTLVLEPDGKPDSLSSGIAGMQGLQKLAVMPAEKLRLANNIALGQQRQGKLNDAIATMLAGQKGIDQYNSFLAQNLGSQAIPASNDDMTKLAASVLATWLDNTSPSNSKYAAVKSNLEKACQAANLKVPELKASPIYLCQAVSLIDGDKSVAILSPIDEVLDSLGKPDKAFKYDEKYPDMLEVLWKGGALSILTERESVMRATSYSPGAYILLRPADSSLTTDFKVSVGMTKDEFAKILNPDNGQKKQLVRAGELEEWLYYPSLNMGICLKDDKVAGVTVTPVK